jgi:hypothetical protein
LVEAAPIAWGQIIGWSLTGIGIAASLVWNLLNRRHTNKVAVDVRVANFRGDQWAGSRGKIEGALENLAQAIEAIVVALPDRTDPTFDAKFQFHNLTLMIKHEAFFEALSDAAGNSEYVTNRNWTDLALGTKTGNESSWDKIQTALEAVGTAATNPETREALAPVRAWFQDIRRGVVVAIRSENMLHDPTPKI